MAISKIKVNGTSHDIKASSCSGNSATATSATKATQDSAGQQINTTYIKGLSVSGKTITYTKGNGTTGTITTQDTDTHYTTGLKVGASATATENQPASNGSVYLNVLDNSTVRDSHKITGSGATEVTSDSSGNITIYSESQTYSDATQSVHGLMSKTDKIKLDGIASGANNYSLPTATSGTLGGVKVGSNITNSSGTISLTKSNVTSALGYTPPTTNTTYSAATTSSAGLMSASDKSKLDGITSSADSVSFTRNLTSGTKVGTITINGTATDLYAPTDTNTTYSAATTSSAGLMSAADKTKLNGIATGANAYTLPTASSSTLGGVKTTSTVTSTSGLTACPIISGVPYYKDTNSTYSLSSFGVTATAAELNKMDGVTATTDELNYVDGVTSNIQTQLNNKAAASHNHAASNITSGTLSSDRLPTVPVSKGGTGATTAAGALTNLGLTATAAELNYTDGVTSNIQTQLNGKLSTSGTAASATKLATARTISLTGAVTGSGSFNGASNLTINTSVGNVPVKGEYLKDDIYYTSARSPDDLTSSNDVGFYIGDGYSLIVTEGSVYGDYNTINQIKITNPYNVAPSLYVRSYNGSTHIWTDWKQIGGSSSASTALYEHTYGFWNSMYEDKVVFTVVDKYSTHGSTASTIISNLSSRLNGKYVAASGKSNYGGGQIVAVHFTGGGFDTAIDTGSQLSTGGGATFANDDYLNLSFYSDRALS